MIKKLTESEFKSTFSPPMSLVNEEEASDIEIIEYVEEVLKDEKINKSLEDLRIDYVYHNSTKNYEQILVNYGIEDNFLIILVDLKNNKIFGYYLLNLKEEYGQ